MKPPLRPLKKTIVKFTPSLLPLHRHMTLRHHRLLLTLGILSLNLPHAHAQKALPAATDHLALSLANDGLAIGCGSMGKFTLAYPALDLGDGKKHEPIEKRVQGASATLSYEGGGKITVATASDKVTLTFDAMPASAKAFSAEMFIPPNYSEGG
ncbi:MAG: hypothetical protein RLZZ214_4137, partial [Verrucomicrobiota bacterium]